MTVSAWPWHDIGSLPNDARMVLAYCPPDGEFPDGRTMIWLASMLSGQFTRIKSGIPQPRHLSFPATLWAEVPVPAVSAPMPAGETAIATLLEDARQEFCLVIAYIGRDQGTDRIEATLNGLVGRAVKMNARITAAALTPEDKDKRNAELEATNTRLLGLIADIREKSGLGAKPMLDELPDAIGALTSKSGNAELIERLTRLRDLSITAITGSNFYQQKNIGDVHGWAERLSLEVANGFSDAIAALSRSPSPDGAEGTADKVIAAIQSVADNPPSHDAGICLDMAIRAVRDSLNATRST